MVPPVAAALAFTYLLNPDLGPVNGVLAHLGIPGPLWFFDPSWSKPALVLLSLWGAGDAMIIYLAGLLDVPQTQIEAAKIDGANAVRRYWHVTLPSLSPVIFFTLVTGLIWTFQTFTEAYVAGNTTSGQKDTPRESRRARCSSTRSGSTSRASATSTWATPPRSPGCCSARRCCARSC